MPRKSYKPAYFTESCHPERSKAATPRRVMTWVLVIMTLLGSSSSIFFSVFAWILP